MAATQTPEEIDIYEQTPTKGQPPPAPARLGFYELEDEGGPFIANRDYHTNERTAGVD